MGGVLAGRAVWGLSDAELRQAFEANIAADRALAAERAAMVAELTARRVPVIHGYTSVIRWLSDTLRINPGAAAQLSRLAKALPELPDVAKAMADGEISCDQAAVIADAVAPFTGQARLEAQRYLVAKGAGMPVHQLREFGESVHHWVDPEGADEAGLKALAAAEKRAQQGRGFTLTPLGNGVVRFSGRTDAEGAAIIQSALDPLCNPARRTLQDIANDSTTSGSAPSDAAETHGTTFGSPAADDIASGSGASGGAPPDAAETHCTTSGGGEAHGAFGSVAAGLDEPLPLPLQDRRTAAQRRHDALLEVFRLALNTGELPENGGGKAQLVLTAAFDPLSQAVSAATLDTGATLSPEAVRRLACDCGVIPAILDNAGVPLDVGRERRLITGALRRALVLRDRGCAFPACDRPARWCQGHHVISWLDGGTTCLHNSVLVCGYHHRLLHHSQWTVHIAADGKPEFTPPATLDPSQTPRRNTYHRRT